MGYVIGGDSLERRPRVKTARDAKKKRLRFYPTNNRTSSAADRYTLPGGITAWDLVHKARELVRLKI